MARTLFRPLTASERTTLNQRFLDNSNSLRIFLLGVCKEYTLSDHERSPAQLGLGVDLRAVIYQVLHDPSLSGCDCADEWGAAIPAWISQDLADQLVHVQRIIQQRVLRIA